MAWNYLKQKTAKTPDARRNDKPVKQEKFVKDKNPVTGTRAARKQIFYFTDQCCVCWSCFFPPIAH